MTHRPGNVQRAILEKLAEGATLWEDDRKPHFFLTYPDSPDRTTVRDWRTACGLVAQGYVTGEPDGKWCTRYTITEQGRAALQETQPCTTS